MIRLSGLFTVFQPKLITALRQGYDFQRFRADAVAGFTVAIVALPLSMAIAIASGVAPERGLYTSIIGGLIVSVLGGSRFQIGGPAGAFIVLVSVTVTQHGLDGLLLATLVSGVLLTAVGLLRLGVFVKYIPYPVTVGFTAGIAVIILASQIRELLGLKLTDEPGPILPKLKALGAALPTLSPITVVVAIATIAIIIVARKYRSHRISFIIAVALVTAVAMAFDLSVETIGSRFGGIARTFPVPVWPDMSWAKMVDIFPNALSFTLLGSIESLLSAVVADTMTGGRHRSNTELIAQGLANIAAPLFGGFCVTGNIARTATNVRAGAQTPVAGALHSLFLLLFILIAAPLAAYVPLAALAGVLVVVAWGMVEKRALAILIRASRGDAVVLLVTFLVVTFHGLSEGILIGFSLSSLLFLHRMASSARVQSMGSASEVSGNDNSDDEAEELYASDLATDPELSVIRLSGAFFFGAASAVGAALERIQEQPKFYILDLSAVSMLDSTGAATVEGFVNQAFARGCGVYIAGAIPPVRRTLLVHGLMPPRIYYHRTIEGAIARARRHLPDHQGNLPEATVSITE